MANDEKLTEVLALCCYKSEALLLIQVAEQRQITRSRLIRALILELLTSPVMSMPLREAVNDKLTTQMATRLSERELQQLEALAHRHQVSPSRLIRQQIGRADAVLVN